jgi:putative ABC transport system permease protein
VATTSTQAIIGEPRVTPINAGGGSFDQPGWGPYGPGPVGDSFVCDPTGCWRVSGNAPPPAPAGQAIELRLTAMTGDIRQFRPFRPESGQWLDFSSAPSLSPRLVLNKEAAKGFTRYRVPAEMRLDGAIANATPRIIGVVDDGATEPAAYVRADELMNWLPALGGAGAYGGGWQVMLGPSAVDVDPTLRARVMATGVAAEEIHTEVINARKSISSQLALMRWVFLGMAAVVLLIGVAGILNVGLATVGERIEEFALRRAVGTPRTLLAAIVLAETLLTGLFTAAAAIGVGAFTLQLVGPYLGAREPALQNMDFPWQAAGAGVIAGLVAGLLGGLIPATRAARIPIATVMRA